MSKVLEMPESERDRLDKELFGVPLHPSWHTVFIEGRKMPNMLIREWDGSIEVLLDGRWIYIFEDRTKARLACSMAANAMAIGQGYPWLGAATKEMPFAPQVMAISGDLPK